jgi:dihydroneopterin triphosphate diphosphatase
MTSFISPFCISAFIVHKHAKGHAYLVIRRSGQYLKGTWQMVSGGIQEGEKAWEAALREIHEETGLIPDKFYSADAVETFYYREKDKVAYVPVFLAIVNERKPVQLSDGEHDAFEWLPFEEARKRLLFAEQKRIIEHVHQNFVLQEPNPFHLIHQDSKK